jgi:hypothetical protein
MVKYLFWFLYLIYNIFVLLIIVNCYYIIIMHLNKGRFVANINSSSDPYPMGNDPSADIEIFSSVLWNLPPRTNIDQNFQQAFLDLYYSNEDASYLDNWDVVNGNLIADPENKGYVFSYYYDCLNSIFEKGYAEDSWRTIIVNIIQTMKSVSQQPDISKNPLVWESIAEMLNSIYFLLRTMKGTNETFDTEAGKLLNLYNQKQYALFSEECDSIIGMINALPKESSAA